MTKDKVDSFIDGYRELCTKYGLMLALTNKNEIDIFTMIYESDIQELDEQIEDWKNGCP